MLAGALMLEPLARTSITPFGAFLGDASYSIYLAHPFGLRLWHLPFERLVGTASVAGIALYVASAVVVGLFVGIATYLLVEKPILSALKRPRLRHDRGDQSDL
jgi:peptidoglycan/LPS O-acetylase OafA/YrhL